jgi:hypothetical protein
LNTPGFIPAQAGDASIPRERESGRDAGPVEVFARVAASEPDARLRGMTHDACRCGGTAAARTAFVATACGDLHA